MNRKINESLRLNTGCQSTGHTESVCDSAEQTEWVCTRREYSRHEYSGSDQMPNRSFRQVLSMALLVAFTVYACPGFASDDSTNPSASTADSASAVEILEALLEDVRSRNGELAADPDNTKAPLLFPLDYGAHPAASAEIWSLHVLAETRKGQWQLLQSRIARLTVAPDRERSNTDSTQGSQQESLWRFKDVYFQSTAQTLVSQSVDGSKTPASFEHTQSLTRGAIGLAFAQTEPGSSLHRVRTPASELIFQALSASEPSGDRSSDTQTNATEKVQSAIDQQDAGCAVDAEFVSDVSGSSFEVRFRSDVCPLQTTELPSMMAYSQQLTVDSGRSGGDAIVAGVAWLDRAWGRLDFGSAPVVADLYRLPISAGNSDRSGVSNQSADSWLLIRVVRRANGTGRPQLSASMYSGAGEDISRSTLTKLDHRDVEFSTTGQWRSQDSGFTYSAGWQLSIPSRDINLRIEPVTANQELQVAGQAIWSGMVEVVDLAGGIRSTMRYGFAELAPEGRAEALAEGS